MASKKIAREFAEPKDPGEVHNKRIAHKKRMRNIEREQGKEAMTDHEQLAAMRQQAEVYRKVHTSTLHDVPDAFRNDKEMALDWEGVEVRLGIPSDPEDQEDA